MPKNSTQDIEAAIAFIEDALDTHEIWARYYLDGGATVPYAGDLARHQTYIAEYNHVLSVLGELQNG